MDVRADGLASLFERHRPEVVFHLAAQAGVRPSLEDPVARRERQHHGHAQRARGRRAHRRAQGHLRGERRHDLRRARRLPVEGDPPRRARARSPRTASRRRWPWTTWRYYQRYRGLDFTALALGNVYGPRQDPDGEAGVIAIFAAKMLAGEAPTIFGDGNQTRDYVFIDDAVHAFVQAMDRGSGKLVNIGTGLETSVNHLYKLLAGHHRVRR